MADLTNLPDKTCRAIWNYLIRTGAVDYNHCFHHFDNRSRDFSEKPIVTVTMLPIGPEVHFDGADEFRVMISVGYNAPDQAAVDFDQPRLDFSKQVGQVRMQMMLSDDGENLIAALKAINAAAALMPVPADGTAQAARFAAVHADMADFTIRKLIPDTYGVVRIEGVAWSVGQAFRVTACESTIIGYT